MFGFSQVLWADLLGIVGVFLVLFYYFLLQTGRCESTDFMFSLGNAIGSVFILISLWFHWNLASVIIEIAWLFISLYGVFRVFSLKVKNHD